MDERLRAKLLARAEADQEFRQGWRRLSDAARRSGFEDDRARAAWLAEVVAARGWPGVALVGEEGARAAWLLAQHADHDVELQERCLALVEAAAEQGDAPLWHVAFLTDRVRVNRSREQVYGTQFHGDGADYGPRPIEDRDSLDARRAAMALEPFAEYFALVSEIQARDG